MCASWLMTLAIAYLADSRLSAPRGADPYIINGRTALPAANPWQISLQVKITKSWTTNYTHACGGTLISLSTVVTAAHCIMVREIQKSRDGPIQVR
ncbi:chymotrypsin-like elastase family member 2A [Galendromus occidentalis]|uniref:Chymotrypsin-like elastase family member 2A n=1 Tax=Galendromus occidentalis TaxID=34638 RepID=A0AAJ6QP38_9ACAR|nr:chymotrypsin-like elastase family member 2A [Galendromus occidentalis]